MNSRSEGFLILSSFVIRHSSFADALSHCLLLLGASARFLGLDRAPLEERHQRIVHQLHPLFLSGLNDARQHVGFRFANDICDRGCVRPRLSRASAIERASVLLSPDEKLRAPVFAPAPPRPPRLGVPPPRPGPSRR